MRHQSKIFGQPSQVWAQGSTLAPVASILDDMKTFTDKVKEIQKRLGTSQNGLAERVGIPRATFSRIARGEADPDRATLVRLAELGGVSVDYLCRDELESAAGSDNLTPVESILLGMARHVGIEESVEALAPLFKARAKRGDGGGGKTKGGA
jgi:transcriptional regulator with XRE-family HTH domain